MDWEMRTRFPVGVWSSTFPPSWSPYAASRRRVRLLSFDSVPFMDVRSSAYLVAQKITSPATIEESDVEMIDGPTESVSSQGSKRQRVSDALIPAPKDVQTILGTL